MQEPWLFSAKRRTITPLGQAMNKLQNTFEAMSMINRGKAPAWCQMEKIHAPDFFLFCLFTYVQVLLSRSLPAFRELTDLPQHCLTKCANMKWRLTRIAF